MEPGKRCFPKLWPVEVKVYKVDGCRWFPEAPECWIAEIQGGCPFDGAQDVWVARGRTRQGAINAVMKRYRDEQERLFV